MWFALTLISLAALAGLQLWWRARYRALQTRHGGEMESSRRRQQQATVDAAAQQQVLLNSMLEGLLLLDRAQKIQLANRSFLNLFGSKAALHGQTVMEALRLHELEELIRRVQAEGQVFDYEIRLPGLNERWLQVNAAVITNAAGEREGTILVFHDLTRLKKLERTREEFVANVSHELRTPLSLIKGYVETLLDGARHDPEVAERFLRIIARNTVRLELLIEDLLIISALESGQLQLEKQPVNLHALAEKVLTDLHAKADGKKISLVNTLSDLSATADMGRLYQVLSNLVDNAIKYGRVEGRVSVSGEILADGRREICVRDDGPGIPPAALARVFERFYRVDKARSRDQGGTGLGLSIVKHIVHAHGGEVRVTSELGEGAAFFFTLPAG